MRRPAPAACRLPSRTVRRDVDDGSALCLVQFHSGESHQPDRGRHAVEAGAADAGGLHEQLFRRQRLRHDLPQDRREDDLQPGSAAEPERTHGFPAELGAVAGDSAVGRRVGNQPDRRRAASGTRSWTATRLARRPFCRRTSWSTARSVTPSTTCTCFRRSTPAMATSSGFRTRASRRTRSTRTCPTWTCAGWLLNGTEPDSRLRRSAMADRGQRRMDEGVAQRQVRRRLHHPAPEPLRDAGAGVHLQRRRDDAAGGAAANNFNRFAAFLLGLPSSRTRAGDDAAARRRRIGRVHRARHTQRVPPEHAAEQQHRHLHPRPVEPDVEDHRVGRRALGVLLAAAPRGSRHRGLRLRRQPAADLRRRTERRQLRHRSREEPVHAAARHRVSADWKTSSSAPAIRATRRATIRAVSRWCRRSRFRRRSSSTKRRRTT